MEIKEFLVKQRLITDGAMGTHFESLHPYNEKIAENYNLTASEQIKEIHKEYIKAGANLIRTNTFAANSLFFDNQTQIKEIVRSGYQIAKRAKEETKKECELNNQEVFIAADIGPIHNAGYLGEEVILEEYKAICDVFLEEGAEIFVFETQSEFTYLPEITKYVKEKKNAFILVQFSFDQTGYTKLGLSIRKMIDLCKNLDTIDAYGFNCGLEAAHLNQLLAKVKFSGNKYISALPNAGYPVELRGKTLYSGNQKYFVEKMQEIAELGVDILGGCCGTTPEYIKGLVKSIEVINRPEKRSGVNQKNKKRTLEADLLQQIDKTKKPIIVELDPPFDTDISKVISGAKLLKESGANLITLADSPLGKTRMDAIQLAAKVQRETKIPVMPHLCCRDKNVIGMRSSLLGSYMNDIRHLLLITGDPVGRESSGQVKPVFDFNSIKLMDYVRQMNEEIFEEPVVFGGALNYHGANPDAILLRMEKKIKAGCSFFLTQPLFSTEDIARIAFFKERIDTKIMCGIMPVVSYKNANFLNNVMPGITIPQELINRFHPSMTREEGEEVAVVFSLELMEALEEISDGYYFMTPFNRAGLIARIIQKRKEKINE